MRRFLMIGWVLIIGSLVGSQGAWGLNPDPTPVAQQAFGTIWDESFYYVENYVPGAPSDHQAPTNQAAWHGRPTDHAYLGAEYDAGIRLKNVYLRWRLFEPTPGNTSNAYIAEKLEEIRQFREKGFGIVLRINPFPVPAWLFSNGALRLKNQYGETWNPEAFGNTPDSMASIWNPASGESAYRAAFQNYINRVFGIFGNNFYAVYLTVGQYGEVAYPVHDYSADRGDDSAWGEDYHGHTNCYWAWDDNARAQLSLRYDGDPEKTAILNFVPGTGAADGERMVNGGFEDHAVGGTERYYAGLGTIPNWMSAAACLTAPGWLPEIKSTDPDEGAQFLRYSAPAGMNYYLRQEAAVKPGTDYRFACHIRAGNGNVGHVTVYAECNGNTEVALALFSDAADWTTLTGTAHSPAGCQRMCVDLAVTRADQQASGSADFDGLSLAVAGQGAVSHSVARKFYEWYIESLAEFANWQIRVIKQAYDGRLILMEGGYAGRSGDIEAEINDDLAGLSRNHYWVRRGFVPDRYLAAITDRVNVYFSNTALEQVERAYQANGALNTSPLQSDWTPPYYMAYLANRFGFCKWSENSGKNTAAQMADAFDNMTGEQVAGLGWYTAGQLTDTQGHGWATIADYKTNVTAHGGAAEPEGYVEGFAGKAGEPLPQWRETASTLRCQKNGSNYVGRMTIAGSAGNCIQSPAIRDLNVREYYDTLEIKISDVQGTAVKVGLQDRQGRCFWAWDALGAPGVYSRKIHSFTYDQGPADLSEFSIVFQKADSAAAGSLDCDTIKIVKTGRSADSYLEHFWGDAGQKPAAWKTPYNTALAVDGQSGGVLSLGAADTYGDAVSPVFRNLDVNANNVIEFKLNRLSASASVTLQMVTVHPDGSEGATLDLANNLRAPGVYRRLVSDFASLDLQQFLVKIWMAGPQGATAVFDYIKIVPAPAALAGFEDHLTGPANQVPYGWRDRSNSNAGNASILGDGATTAGMQVSGEAAYGDIQTPDIYGLDTTQYSAVEFKIDQVPAGSYLDVTLREAWGSQRDFGAFSKIDEPGVYRKRLSSMSTEADLRAFKLVFWVNDSATPHGVIRIDTFKLVPAVPTPTVTVANGYEEHFAGAVQELPQGWRDLTAFEEYNATLKANGASGGVIRLKAAGAYGDVMSPIFTDWDQANYGTLEIKLDQITGNGWLDIGIQEETGEKRYYSALAHVDTPGVYRVKLDTATGGATLGQFSLKFWINGTAGVTTATLDSVRIIPNPALPTVTPAAEYPEHFTGAQYYTPEGWRDSNTYGEYNATLRGDGSTCARLQLGSANTYGDVISPVIVNLNTSAYTTLEIKLDQITGNGWLDIGIQEETGEKRYFTALARVDALGLYRVKLADVANGADLTQFSVKLWINGTAGVTAAFLDSVRVMAWPAVPVVTPAGEYSEHFTGLPAFTPEGWRDRNTFGEFNATLRGDGVSAATLRRGWAQTYGDVVSPVIANLNTQAYTTLEVKLDEITGSGWLDIGIQEETGQCRYFPAFAHVDAAGTYQVKLANVASGADLSRFSIKFWINGDAGNTVTARLDSVRVVAPAPPAYVNYGSFFGGNLEDRVKAMGLDPQGNIYLVGETRSTRGLPFTPGADSTLEGESDAFIVKLSPDGKNVIYCTLLGGNSRDYAEGVAADGNGNAYVTGATWSDQDFPCTVNALSSSLGGGRDAFVAKLDASGCLRYCTYLGGSHWDYGFCIDSDNENTVYVGGFTHGSFPVTVGAAQTNFGGLGDGFVTKLHWTAYATEMVYSTYLGGRYWESVGALKVRGQRVYLVTDTQSPDFPVTARALDKVNTVPCPNSGGDGSFTVLNQWGNLCYSTFLGAEDSPAGTAYDGLDVSEDGKTVYLVGYTNEPHFPATASALQPALGGGRDGVLVKLTQNTLDQYDLAYATFLGGEGEETATSALLDAAGNLWVSGCTTSAHFPANTVANGGCDLFSLYLDGGDCHLVEARRFGGSADDGVASDGQQRGISAATLMTGSNSVWMAGCTASADFPKTADARQPDYGGALDAFTVKCGRPDYGTMTILPTPAPTPAPAVPGECLYASYLGLSGSDKVQDIYTDANGCVYLAGSTTSVGLATPNGYDRTFHGVEDAFVAKFDAAGHLLFCTYLGGCDTDIARGVVTDAAGNIYVTGATWSANFPATGNALSCTLNGGRDAFVAKLSPNGSQLLYCTYLGGPNWDYGFCIDTDATDTVYVGGFTHGSFPVTAGAAQANFGGMGDGFITKLTWNSSSTTQVYGTYLGGCFWESVSDLKVRNGQVYAAGCAQSPNFPTTANALDRVNTVSGANYGGDGFVSILSAEGTQWVYSTFYGSENSPRVSGFNALDVAGNGDAIYLAGNSSETGFQTTAGAMQRQYGGGNNDGVLIKLVKSASGYDLGFSTFLGGSGDDLATDVARDASGKVWVTGITDASDFPVNSQSLGARDLFALYLDEAGQLLWSGRYGGSGAEGESNNGLSARAAAGGNAALCIAGLTCSDNCPTTSDADQRHGGGNMDSYLIKLAQPTAYLTPTPTPTPAPATFWMEGFNGEAGQQPANWKDETQDSQFNCEIAYASQTSEALLTRTQDSDWGKVQSPVIACDAAQYPWVELQITAMDAGTACKLALQEEGGTWQVYDLADGVNLAGTYVYNYQALTGWSGSHSFRVQVMVEGAGGKTVRLGGVRIFRAGAAPAGAWVDDFGGTVGQQPAGWTDDTDDPNLNLNISYGPAESQAQLVRTSEDAWGKVLSPNLHCDVTANPVVEVVVDQIDPGAAWKLGVMDSGTYQSWILTDSRSDTGTVRCNYAQVTGWSGARDFKLQLVVEGAAGQKAVFNRVRVISENAAPAATPTPVPNDAYREDFSGLAGAQPSGWLDASNQSAYHAEIAYSATASLAAITRTAEDSWGKVLSPLIHADASAYPVIEIRVASLSTDTTWKIGIQEVNGAWRYWDLNASTSGAGIFAFDYAAATGWNGEHDFQVQITAEGAAGKGLELDWIRLCASSAVHGAAVRAHYARPKTPSAGAVLADTPTATPTPWLGAGQVRAYPNPARNRVNFAYTVSGPVKVTVDVYHVNGDRVARIREDRDGGSGQTLVTVWDTRGLAAGIYFYRLEVKAADNGTVLSKIQKLAIVR